MSASPAARSSRRYRWLTAVFGLLAAAALLSAGALLARERYLTRGLPDGLPGPIPAGGPRAGVNVYLERYPAEELPAALATIRATGIEVVKQPFSYRQPFDWDASDRLMEAVRDADLTVVPLLDGDPATGHAPPADLAAFADWAAAFARRYGDQVDAYIIWDEPNLAGHWGGQPVNPGDYAALLSAAAAAIRASDPGATVVAAPLAPTTETGPDNLAEPLFLQALYDAGAAGAFDAVAAKPYGFDTGPDDRRATLDRLNFSRAILLREVVEANGDADTAVWAGNWGWNSLPPDWSGRPSIWGQTDPATQAAQTVAALERARREWPWMGLMFLENWEPDTTPDDPRWGFSIAGRPTSAALADYLGQLPAGVAGPGFHPADPADPAQVYDGAWEFSPDFGADIGQSGDRVRFTFWGTEVGVRVRRADFRARLYATVDGQPANALPRDENGATLVLTAADPAEDTLSTEWIARDLEPGVHVLEIVASRGWDQWALNGFSVSYTPAGARQPAAVAALALAGGVFAVLAIFAARRAEWGTPARAVAVRFGGLSDRAQLLVGAALAAVVGLTGWLTWGPEALGIYRRLGDGGQLAATAATAAVFYVTPTVVVYALALAALFGLLVLRPAWGLALIALTMPLYVAPVAKPMLGYRFSPVEVFILVATAAWATRALLDAGARARRGALSWPRPTFRPADAAVAALVLVATVSLAFTERVGVATNEWRVVIFEPALFYLLLRAVRPRSSEMWVVLDAFVISGLLVAGVGLWQVVTGQGLITAEAGLLRLRSFYGSPNNVALYLDRLLPLLVAMVLLGRAANPRRRLAWGLAAIPVAAALVLTFSKGALFLGIPASLLVVFWLWQRRAGRRAWPWVAGALAAGLVTLLVAMQVPALAARLDLFGATGVFRVNLWRASLNMIADHPLFGVGLDNFLYAYRGRYILDAAWQEPNLSHPHNLVLDFATRLGLLGLLAGIWLVVEAVWALRQGWRRADAAWLPVAAGFSGTLAAVLAHGLVDHSFFLVDLALVFYLMLGTAVWVADGRHQPGVA